MSLPQLNFPEFDFKIKQENKHLHIFDKIRKKWLVASPEEWVRQNLLTYLTERLNYPVNLIAIEKKLEIAKRKLRFDALVYDKSFKPLVIIECKAHTIKITQESFDQILTYNYLVKAPYLLVTNGLFHVFCEIKDNSGFSFMEEIPDFKNIS